MIIEAKRITSFSHYFFVYRAKAIVFSNKSEVYKLDLHLNDLFYYECKLKNIQTALVLNIIHMIYFIFNKDN